MFKKKFPFFFPPPGLELPFMMMPHPLIPVSLPPASVTMAMSQMNHLSTIANMAAAAQVQSPPSRVETSVIKVTILNNKIKRTRNCHKYCKGVRCCKVSHKVNMYEKLNRGSSGNPEGCWWPLLSSQFSSPSLNQY